MVDACLGDISGCRASGGRSPKSDWSLGALLLSGEFSRVGVGLRLGELEVDALEVGAGDVLGVEAPELC